MKQRKRFFDDRIWYDPIEDRIWIGRPDSRMAPDPWDWWITSNDGRFMGPERCFGPPEHFIEIAREPEMSICGGPREL